MAATGRGLLFDLTQALTRLSLQISSAKISTWGERVVDVFYVKDLFGLKVHKEEKLVRIRETLRPHPLQQQGRARAREDARRGAGRGVSVAERYPVIIVGSGPTGLTLANLLGAAGIGVLLVERNAETVQEPRAVSIDDESLAHHAGGRAGGDGA